MEPIASIRKSSIKNAIRIPFFFGLSMTSFVSNRAGDGDTLGKLFSPLNKNDITRPIVIEIINTPIIRHKASTGPMILNTNAMLIMFIAGPAYRNVKAGPIPQPRFKMLVKIGTILQEQVGRI